MFIMLSIYFSISLLQLGSLCRTEGERRGPGAGRAGCVLLPMGP